MSKYHLEVGESNIYIVNNDGDVMDATIVASLPSLEELVKHFALVPQYEPGSDFFSFPINNGVTLDELNEVWLIVKTFLNEHDPPEDGTKTIPLREVFMNDDEWWDEYDPILEDDETTINQYWTEEELNTALQENRIWTLIAPTEEEGDYYVNKYLTRFISGFVILHCITRKAYNPLQRIHVHIKGSNE